MREELIHLLVAGLECLVIFLRQVVEGRLDDVVLLEVGSIGVRASFLHGWSSRFPSGVSKMCMNIIKQGVRSSYLKQENRTLRFSKPDYLVSSIPIAVRGTARIDEEALSSAKQHLDNREGRTTMNPRGCGSDYKI
jgi:hypothetical protein